MVRERLACLLVCFLTLALRAVRLELLLTGGEASWYCSVLSVLKLKSVQCQKFSLAMSSHRVAHSKLSARQLKYSKEA